MRGYDSALNWAQNQEIIYSNLQNLVEQRHIVDQVAGINSAQASIRTQQQIEQLKFKNEAIGVRGEDLDLQRKLHQSKFTYQETQISEKFGRDLGSMRAMSAAKGIDLDESFSTVQTELVFRFNRDKSIRKRNFLLEQQLINNKKSLLDIEAKSNISQMNALKGLAATELQKIELNRKSSASNIDAQIRAIHIKRKYGEQSGSARAAGSIINAQGARVNIPF